MGKPAICEILRRSRSEFGGQTGEKSLKICFCLFILLLAVISCVACGETATVKPYDGRNAVKEVSVSTDKEDDSGMLRKAGGSVHDDRTGCDISGTAQALGNAFGASGVYDRSSDPSTQVTVTY